MKIEKINDHQVRFTLTIEDLAARQIQLRELAYGTEKAKELFREMLQEAAMQVGFEAENIPLMIEAVPMQSGALVLVVTKVENPEELDPRFSGFAPSVGRQGAALGALEQLLRALTAKPDEADTSDPSSAARTSDSMDSKTVLRQMREYAVCHRLYSFRDMDQVLKASARIKDSYTGDSILFGESGNYQLFLKMKDAQQASDLQGVLAAVSEFGTPQPITYAREQYLREHGELLIPDHAIEKLAAFA